MIKRKICPECGSDQISPVGGETGQWICEECGYSSEEFVEEPIIGEEEEDDFEEENIDLEEKPKKKTKTVSKKPSKTKRKK